MKDKASEKCSISRISTLVEKGLTPDIVDDIAVFTNNIYTVCRRDKFVHHILINKF